MPSYLYKFSLGNPETDIYYQTATCNPSKVLCADYLKKYCDCGDMNFDVFFNVIEKGEFREVTSIEEIPKNRRHEIPYSDLIEEEKYIYEILSGYKPYTTN